MKTKEDLINECIENVRWYIEHGYTVDLALHTVRSSTILSDKAWLEVEKGVLVGAGSKI